MKEVAELRIPEEHAKRFLALDEGVSLGGCVRKLEIDIASTRFAEIGMIDKRLRLEGRCFVTACRIRRSYSKSKIDAAGLFHFRITSIFEPCGEECGTKYDESTACPHCGADARIVTPLYLPENRIPKSKDISRTIANEYVVSRRVFDLFERNEVSGVELRPIHASPSSSAESKNWFQLLVLNANAEVVSPTRVGTDLFDEDEKAEFRCPFGDLIGLNLLSEVTIKSESLVDADIMCTRQFVGLRRGLLRPERIILISPKIRELIISEKIKGVETEVAHVA